MSDPFVAEIRVFPYNFAPRGWADCNGQLMPISQNTALFSLIGTTYGGDGKTTFALPDLRGRAPMGWGNGPGLTSRPLGEDTGAATVALNATEMPVHTHTLRAAADVAELNTPGPARSLARSSGGAAFQSTPTTTMDAGAVAAAGGGAPHNNLQPVLVLRCCIALTGIYPPRS